jgi:hypothetical protein
VTQFLLDADNYFEVLFRERWSKAEAGILWWARFREVRDSLETQEESYNKFTETGHMVDHGWSHANQLYLSLPRFLWAIEIFNASVILNNPAELYTFLVCAYVHDVGMHCLSDDFNEFLHESEKEDFPFLSKALTEERNGIWGLKEGIRELAHPTVIRKLHPEIGAWMCLRENGLPCNFAKEERMAIAQVVFRHAKRAPKDGAENIIVRIPGEESCQTVRVGLVASLIALSDACQLGVKRTANYDNHLRWIAQKIQQYERIFNALPERESEDKTYVGSKLKTLKNQPAHIRKHTVVKEVSVGPQGIIVMPCSADAPYWSQHKMERFPHLNLIDDRTVGTIIRDACEEINQELGSLQDHGSLLSFLSTVSPTGIKIPPIPIITEECWNECKRRALKNDNLWREHLAKRKTITNFITMNKPVVFDPYHVRNLRQKEIEDALRGLSEKQAVELVGPPGIGKSALVREMLDHLDCVYHDFDLVNQDTPEALCRAIGSRLHDGGYADTLGLDGLMLKIVEEPFVFWISNYNEASLKSVLTRFQAERERTTVSARWVIESMRATLGGNLAMRIDVGGLANKDMSRILSAIPSGGLYEDPEDVLRIAHGNPGRAIRLWQSATDADADSAEKAVDRFDWFNRQLRGEEKDILCVICQIASMCPLGMTANMLLTAVTYSLPSLPAVTIKQNLNSLLEKLENQRLADVIRFGRDTFGGLLDELVPESTELTVLDNISPWLVTFILQSLDNKRKKEIYRCFLRALGSDTCPDSLAAITYSINAGNLESFYRSSFRFTSLANVLDWIISSRWATEDPVQAYLVKALRLLPIINNQYLSDVEEEKPLVMDSTTKFAYDFLRARTVMNQHAEDIDLDFIREWAEHCEDSELQVWIYASLAIALQRSDCDKEAWEILKVLPARYDPGKGARTAAVHQVLYFLNGSKRRKDVVNESESLELIRSYARELIEEGLRIENLQLICEALFYYVRSQEWTEARNSFRDIIRYRAAISFVEQAPRTRPTQRLRNLLTHGSIHRHICRKSNLTWAEFRENLEKGWPYYVQAYRSAVARRNAHHVLNAVSYMMDFCMKTLHFWEVEAATGLILDRSMEVLKYWKDAEKQIRDTHVWGKKNDDILLSINQSQPILSCAVLSRIELDSVVKDSLKDYLQDYSKEVDVLIDAGNWRAVNKRIPHSLNRLRQALVLAQRTCDQERIKEVFFVLRQPLQFLLMTTVRIKTDEIRKQRAKLAQLYESLSGTTLRGFGCLSQRHLGNKYAFIESVNGCSFFLPFSNIIDGILKNMLDSKTITNCRDKDGNEYWVEFEDGGKKEGGKDQAPVAKKVRLSDRV